MKKAKLVVTLLTGAFIVVVFESGVNSPTHAAGAPQGYCGDPAGGNKTCNTTGCHTGPTPISQTGWITSNIPVSGYVPGTTYTVTATAIRAGHTKFGFEVSPQNNAGTFLGTLVNTNTQTQLAGNYVTHTNTGTSGTGSKTWTFNWTAPVLGSGSVTFFGAFNITNSSNNALGDTIYKSTLIVPENTTTGISNLSIDKPTIKVFPNPTSEQINVKYFLTESNAVEIRLLNIQGKKLTTLFSEMNEDGFHVQTFDINGKYEPGVYFVQTIIGQKSTIEKIVII